MSQFDIAVTAPIVVGVFLLLVDHWLNHGNHK